MHGEFLVEVESQLNKSEFSVNLKILSHSTPIPVYFHQTASASTALRNTRTSCWNVEGNPPSSTLSVAIPCVTGLACHTGYKIHLQKSIKTKEITNFAKWQRTHSLLFFSSAVKAHTQYLRDPFLCLPNVAANKCLPSPKSILRPLLCSSHHLLKLCKKCVWGVHNLLSQTQKT